MLPTESSCAVLFFSTFEPESCKNHRRDDDPFVHSSAISSFTDAFVVYNKKLPALDTEKISRDYLALVGLAPGIQVLFHNYLFPYYNDASASWKDRW